MFPTLDLLKNPRQWFDTLPEGDQAALLDAFKAHDQPRAVRLIKALIGDAVRAELGAALRAGGKRRRRTRGQS